MKLRSTLPILICLSAPLLGAGLLAGCGEAPAMPEQELNAKQDLNAIAQRAYQEQKTWDTLAPADKDAYMKFYKDEAKAKESFQKALEGMRYFFGGGGGAPGSTPGGR